MYEGEWNEDVMHGVGKMIYPNGDVYEGKLLNGKGNGLGIYVN